MNYSALRGRIIEIFGNYGDFATSMGFSRSSLSQKLNGNVDWSSAQVLKAAALLKFSNDEIGRYFFTERV